MLSVVIVTYNSEEFIKSCLESVFIQGYKDFEVIVIDNGSQDKTNGLIRNTYPQINLIRNDKNEGACKARNQGVEIAKGKYILTLDCDVVLDKDFLIRIVEVLESCDKNVGIVQPKIFKSDKRTIFSTGIYLSKLRRFYDIGNDVTDKGQFQRQRYVFGACSAAALYKKEMLEDIKDNNGYFDERFFFLVEDADLAWRAQKCGWKALYLPSAICYHSGDSSKTTKKIRQYLSFRNRYLTMLKNDGILGILIRLPFLIFYDVPRFLYLLATNRYIWLKI